MITYRYGKNIYLNITNACTMRCFYCIKDKWHFKFRGRNLMLRKEPSYEQIIGSFKRTLSKNNDVKEAVFCGYGEPTLRLGVLKRVAGYLKQNSFIVRINTNGQGNLIHKRNIIPELAGLVDTVYISLNAESAKKYFEFNHPRFGLETFNKVLEFIKICKKYIPEVVMTTVELPGIDVKKCEKIAASLGVEFLRRPYLDGYERE